MLDRVETVGCPLTNGDEILPTTASVLSDISSTGGGGGASKGSGGGGGGTDDSAGGRGGRSSVPVARNKETRNGNYTLFRTSVSHLRTFHSRPRAINRVK